MWMRSLLLLFLTSNLSLISTRDVCESDSCELAAERILDYMDTKVDPCNNFYHFACGNYIKTKTIPDHFGGINPLYESQITVDGRLLEILNEPISDGELTVFKDAKKLYRACTDSEAIESLGTAPLLEKISQIGGWPVLGRGDWSESEWTWAEVVRKLVRNGFFNGYIFSLYVDTDYKNSSRRIAGIFVANLGLDREYFMRKDERFEKYKNLQIDLVQMLNSTLPRHEIEAHMTKVLEFEWLLANSSRAKEDIANDVDSTIHPMSIEKLQAQYPYIEWLAYINSIMPSDTQFTPDAIINNGEPSYFERLGKILAHTPKEVLANYLMWRVTLESVHYLSQAFRDRYFEYKAGFFGSKRPQSRQLQCVATARNFFPQAVGALFVRKHFKRETKAKVHEMVDLVKIAFKDNLEAVGWMDDEARRAVRAKVDNMHALIGSANELYDDERLGEYYSNFAVEVDAANYFDSVHRVKAAKSELFMGKLNEPVRRDDWTQFPSVVVANAYMQYSHNRLVILAAALQEPLLDVALPQYMNFGSTGMTLGHELTHAFDNVGSQFDEQGNVMSWWSDETVRNFGSLKECFIEQYSNFIEPITGLRLSGERTQGENIADSSGAKFSYKAYERWTKVHGDEKMLPGLALNQRQLFWVAGESLITNMPIMMFNMPILKVHNHNAVFFEKRYLSTGSTRIQFRVNGAFGNSPDFARDFNCSATSAMNFTRKCAVW